MIKSGRGYRFDKDGWIYIHIEGGAFERGRQHGFLVAKELAAIKSNLQYLTYFDTGKKWEFFVQAAEMLFASRIDDEFQNEMMGIADGARQAGTDITWQEILAWNGYEELTDYWWPTVMSKLRYAENPTSVFYQQQVKDSRVSHYPDGPELSGGKRDHCSAFMAHNKMTRHGDVVMAHNSFDNFEHGQFSNLILDIIPDKGNKMFMQSAPGYIDSFADFFITSANIMGTETTIGGFSLYDPTGEPEFSRIRKAMQYGNTLDEYVEIMKNNNNGGYANSWLFANINSNDIMRFELGLKYWNVELNPKEGYFIGFNAPIDPRIRNLECSNTGYADIRRHQGARQVRLFQLMKKHKGKIDCEIGKEILADHYDVFLKKENNPSSRTVDGHYELDRRDFMSDPSRPKPYRPRGAVDGKVCCSKMAEDMSFLARWGNSSGLDFNADKHLDEHPQWEYLRGHLLSRPSQPWSEFRSEETK